MLYDQLILTNAFSINMLDENQLLDPYAEMVVRFEKITPHTAASEIAVAITYGCFRNSIGHRTSDALVRKQLTSLVDSYGASSEQFIKGVRETVKLSGTERVIVAQYQGPRLPERAIELPEGATFQYWRVKI